MMHEGSNKFVGVENIATQFTIPGKDFSEIDELSFKQKSDLHSNQNKLTIELLEKAVVHVRQYDSLATATKLVGRAFQRCPSIFVKRMIVDANRSLKAAIKADSWSRSRKRKRHVDESTIRRNLDSFYEKTAEAVAAMRLDLDKTNLTLFSKVKKQYESTLPLTLPDTKSAIKTTAHIVAMCEGSPSSKNKVIRLEGLLFLIENVTVLGINNKLNKDTHEKATQIARKRGFTVYHEKLVRPSENIDWYLALDFGCNVKFASFADNMDVAEDDYSENSSYEGYLKRQSEEQLIQQQLKTKRLQNLRQAFNDDNIVIIEDLKRLRIEVDNMLFERAKISEDFNSITNVTGENSGIDITHSRKLYGKTIEYRQYLMTQGYEFEAANNMCIKQRIEAKTRFYDYQEVTFDLKFTRNRIAFLEEELSTRRERYLKKMGMISLSKYVGNLE